MTMSLSSAWINRLFWLVALLGCCLPWIYADHRPGSGAAFVLAGLDVLPGMAAAGLAGFGVWLSLSRSAERRPLIQLKLAVLLVLLTLFVYTAMRWWVPAGTEDNYGWFPYSGTRAAYGWFITLIASTAAVIWLGNEACAARRASR